MQTTFLPKHYWHPKYWPTWIGLGFLWLLIQLPYNTRFAAGRLLGRIGMRILPSRRKITAINLALCFPELSPEQQKKLLVESFESVGIGMIEMAMAWWSPIKEFESRIIYEGFEQLEKARAEGIPVILLGAHFTTLDLLGRCVAIKYKLSVSYRPAKNPIIDAFLKQGRDTFFENAYSRDNPRDFIRALKRNEALWYAADQDYGTRNSVFAPFFGVPAATVTVTSKLAAMTGAKVLPLMQERLPNNKGYKVTLHPPLENFPSGDLVADATLTNQVLEEAVRKVPEQYLWQHRRFKTRPAGEAKLYPPKRRRRRRR